MAKLDEIMFELNAFETGIQKTASKSKTSRLANSLNKLAEEIADDEEDEENEEENEEVAEALAEEAAKEGSCKRTVKKAGKKRISPQAIVNSFRKTAVLNNADTQGSTVSVGAKPGDGAATNAARKTDNIISYESVESQAESNPERHYDSETADLIEDEAPNSEALVKELKEGSLRLYTREEADALQKFASYGYNAFVNDMADQLVQEKVASMVSAKQASMAVERLADREIAKTAAARNYDADVYTKLAALREENPALFYQLQQAALNGEL